MALAIPTLTRLTAQWDSPPMVVTVSHRPLAGPGLLEHVYGTARAANLVIERTGWSLIRFSNGVRTAFPSPGEAIAAIVQEAAGSLMVRIFDPAAVRILNEQQPSVLRIARAVWLSCRDTEREAQCGQVLASHGFSCLTPFDDHDGKLFSRTPLATDPRPSYAEARETWLKTLVLVDNNLTGERGHYLSIASRIALGAQQSGCQMVWATHRRFRPGDAPPGVEVVPIFGQSIFDVPPREQATADFAPEIAEAWRELFRTYPKATTQFVVPTADGHHIRAVHRLLQAREMSREIVHLSTPYETRHMPSRSASREIDWYLAQLAAHPAFGRTLFLWTETGSHAALFSDRLQRRVFALPLPAPSWDGRIPTRSDAGPLVIAFLGEARVDKGFLDLPDIAAAILMASDRPDEIRVAIHTHPPHGGYTTELADALARLHALAGVRCHTEPMTDDDYDTALFGADCVLLPYLPAYYAVRGSGILIEALASGRSVMARAGTAVEEYPDQGDVHLCDELADWTTATRRLLDNRALVSRQAPLEADAFSRRFAPRGYVDRLAARAAFASGRRESGA